MRAELVLVRHAESAAPTLDEPVVDGAPGPAFTARFQRLHAIAADYRITLIDWISSYDDRFRPVRLMSSVPNEDWWKANSDQD